MAKDDSKTVVTKKILNEAVDTILQGMDNMLIEQKKYFASKDDLKDVKEELKTEIGWLKDDVNGLKAGLSGVPSIKQFNDLDKKVGKYIAL